MGQLHRQGGAMPPKHISHVSFCDCHHVTADATRSTAVSHQHLLYLHLSTPTCHLWFGITSEHHRIEDMNLVSLTGALYGAGWRCREGGMYVAGYTIAWIVATETVDVLVVWLLVTHQLCNACVNGEDWNPA